MKGADTLLARLVMGLFSPLIIPYLLHMLRYFFASLLLLALVGAEANAQTRPRAARRKIAPYSSRGAARKPAANINPHTGKPYGAGVPEEIKTGSMSYLAPSMPMRKQVGYQKMGGYNDNRTPRPAYKKPANSTLNRDNTAPVAPAKAKRK